MTGWVTGRVSLIEIDLGGFIAAAAEARCVKNASRRSRASYRQIFRA